MSSKNLRVLFFCLVFLAGAWAANAQIPDFSDGVPPELLDSMGFSPDTLSPADSIDGYAGETTRQALDSPVEYYASDSIDYDIEAQKVYLFGNASIEFKTITLSADYIEFDMGTERVFAMGRTDSLGNVSGKPDFTEGEENFESRELSYNFRTKKGIITDLVSAQCRYKTPAKWSYSYKGWEIHYL